MERDSLNHKYIKDQEETLYFRKMLVLKKGLYKAMREQLTVL